MKLIFRITICVILLVFIPFLLSAQNKGTFVDSRDNHTYKWVKISDQTWMAENLNYKTKTGSWYYNNDSVNSNGLLYNYESIQNGMKQDSSKFQGICPSGWHLPMVSEWDKLFNSIGRGLSGEKLKSVKFKGGTDNFGFCALPNGRCYSINKTITFENKDTHAYFWSCTERDQTTVWGFFIYSEMSIVSKIDPEKSYGLSVRCIKN